MSCKQTKFYKPVPTTKKKQLSLCTQNLFAIYPMKKTPFQGLIVNKGWRRPTSPWTIPPLPHAKTTQVTAHENDIRSVSIVCRSNLCCTTIVRKSFGGQNDHHVLTVPRLNEWMRSHDLTRVFGAFFCWQKREVSGKKASLTEQKKGSDLFVALLLYNDIYWFGTISLMDNKKIRTVLPLVTH